MKSCENKNSLSGGFQWRFLDDLPPGEYDGPHPNLPKTVYQLNKDYKIISVFKSIGEAAKKTKIHQAAISKCCNHNKNYPTAGGYIWRFENDLSEVLV